MSDVGQLRLKYDGYYFNEQLNCFKIQYQKWCIHCSEDTWADTGQEILMDIDMSERKPRILSVRMGPLDKSEPRA